MTQRPLPIAVKSQIQRLFKRRFFVDRSGTQHSIDNTSPQFEEAIFLAKLVVDLRPSATLEIGLALGVSSVAISSAKRQVGIDTPHIALDPFQDTLCGGVGLQILAESGFISSVAWVKEFSETYLPSALQSGQKFDFVFVDGAHDIGQVVLEAYWIKRLLNPGGIVAFHDGLLPSTSAAARYLIGECGYRIIDAAQGNLERVVKILTSLRHLPSIGCWHWLNLVPRMCKSLIVLQSSG
jgi:predicted O-methyltransferase YrrM